MNDVTSDSGVVSDSPLGTMMLNSEGFGEDFEAPWLYRNYATWWLAMSCWCSEE
jgi:hypothetical protein